MTKGSLSSERIGLLIHFFLFFKVTPTTNESEMMMSEVRSECDVGREKATFVKFVVRSTEAVQRVFVCSAWQRSRLDTLSIPDGVHIAWKWLDREGYGVGGVPRGRARTVYRVSEETSKPIT